MEISPEEKKRIEEEEARIQAEKQAAEGGSTTKLAPNKAGLLCYVGFWVTGIIFLIIERKNKWVRFHAMQSLVVFGILNIIWGIPWNIANAARWATRGYWGGFYPGLYHGRLYKVGLFGLGNLAERMIAKLDGSK